MTTAGDLSSDLFGLLLLLSAASCRGRILLLFSFGSLLIAYLVGCSDAS